MKKGGKQHGSAYFDSFIRSKGPRFLLEERPENLMRKIPVLIKDIAYGNIAIEKYGQYFDEHFTKAIIMPVLGKLCVEKQIHYLAMKDYIEKYPKDDTAFKLLEEDGDLASAYALAYQGFYNICVYNGDLRYIPIMSNQLKRYRFKL
jgi:hypothetical protein